MTNRVEGCKARDTGRPLDDLLNTIAAEHGISAVELLGGAVIGEAGWREHAIRERKWPDVSYGFGQPAVKWFDYVVLDMIARWARVQFITSPDGTLADTPSNRSTIRTWMWDAERALRYVTPRYARLRAIYGDPVEAWCRWNKPNVEGAANPNRPHIARSLAEAEQYRVKEEQPMPTPIIMPVRDEFADTPEGLAEFQKSLLEYAVAADLMGDAEAGVEAMKVLNPDRYEDLVARPK